MRKLCLNCNEEKEIHAKGLCKLCYNRQWQKKNRKRYLEYHKRYDQEKRKTNKCIKCGIKIDIRSKKCRGCANKMENNPNWKNGIITHRDGRVVICAPDNPMAQKNGYVLRSRLVMSKIIGRPLEPKEVVHHIDGNTQNDDSNNLWLFKNMSEHKKFESKQFKLISDKLMELGYISQEKIYKLLRTILEENG